ncbi:GPI-anchored protein [Hirschfeldia incana]|nr:GPI-anchored protein [Hirschfeldia incana]
MVKFSGCLVHRLLLFIIWLSTFQDVVAAAHYKANEHTSKSTTAELANPPGIGVSGPIQVSPSVIPKYTSPAIPWTPPMYPTFPDTYKPKLTGKCTADFQTLSSIIDTAASDCSQPFAALVGNVICCPQFVSLLHIFQGQHDLKSDQLVLPDAVATDCFSDIVSILVSKRANMTIPALCSVTSSNLTGGSCPVQDVAGFEKAVNSSKLLDACRTVDPLKECCRLVCQGAILEASLIISGHQTTVGEGSNNVNALNDCKNVVFSYIARKLPADKANTAFRILSSCKVNKACPLEIKEPTEVIKACRNVAAPSPSCCSSLNAYISGIRNQMLITNKQAIVCATVMGSMLRKGGVMTNIYELCDVDLKDFSVQAYGMQQGCLLRSYPADLIFDNTTGYSFTCDLTDNIAAPWPSSSSMSSLSLCAPEMSLPALPTSQTLRNHGFRGGGAFGALRLIIILVFMFSPLLLLLRTFSQSLRRTSTFYYTRVQGRRRSNVSNRHIASFVCDTMQTVIHNLPFCSFNSIIIERKQRLQLSSSSVTLPPTLSVQPRFFCTVARNKQFVAVCAAPSDVETSSKDESVLITTVETGNSNEVKVHVEVSGEKTQTVFNAVFEKMVAAAQPIPGFRRVKGGKTPDIPKEILLEILGYSKVYRQVIKKLINSAIEDYVKQEDLKVGKELSVEQSYEDLEETFEPGESFSFDATIKLQEAS